MAWPPTTHQDAVDEVDTLRDGKGWATTLGARQRITEAVRVSPLLWVVGRWYQPHLVGSTTTVAPTASELRLIPLYIPVARAVDRVGCHVSTAGTGGHVARLGIYNASPTSGLPTTVLVDAGTVLVDTVGAKEVAITATLHGLYWLGLTAQSGTFTALTTTGLAFIAGSTSAHAIPSNALAYASVSPTSALPDRTGVAPVFSVAVAVPTVGVRAV